jgi:alpha,alpha-trehalose phosphorylase (configuration-retaining)
MHHVRWWVFTFINIFTDHDARFFGPSQSPLLQVGYGGLVETDASFRSYMCTIEDYKTTCGDRTWESMMKFANSLKKRGTKVAFFSSTPQGGGVALMRHALVRFAKVVGVNLSW